MDDNKKQYDITLPDGRKTTWSEDQWAKAGEKLRAKYPGAVIKESQVAAPAPQTVQAQPESGTMYDITLPDGRKTTWSQEQYDKAGSKLREKYPNAEIITRNVEAQPTSNAQAEQPVDPTDVAQEQQVQQAVAEDQSWRDAMKASVAGRSAQVGQMTQGAEGLAQQVKDNTQAMAENLQQMDAEKAIGRKLQKSHYDSEREKYYTAREEAKKASMDLEALKKEHEDLLAADARAMTPEQIARMREIEAELIPANERVEQANARAKNSEYYAQQKENYARNLEAMMLYSDLADRLTKEYTGEANKLELMGTPLGRRIVEQIEGEEPLGPKRDMNQVREDALNYAMAAKLAKDVMDRQNAPNESNVKDNGYLASMWKGAKDTVNAPEFWSDIAKMQEYNALHRLHEKVLSKINSYNGLTAEKAAKIFQDELTPSEQVLLRSFLMSGEATEFLDNKPHWAYNAGAEAANSAKFAAEFMLLSGITQPLRQAAMAGVEAWLTGKVGAEAAAQKATNWFIKAAAEDAGAMVVTPIQMLGSPSTFSKISEDLAQVNEFGQLNGFWSSLRHTLADSAVEDLTEFGFGPFNKILGKGNDAFQAAMKQHGIRAFAMTDNVRQFLNRAGISSLLEEYGEEVNGALIRTILNIDPNAWNDFTELDNQLTTLASFGLTIGGGALVSQAQHAAAYASSKRADSRLAEAMYQRGYTEDQVKAYMEATDVQNGFDPAVYSRLILQNRGDREMLGLITDQLTKKQIKNGSEAVVHVEQEKRRNQKQQELVARYGTDFWQTDENGKQTVRTLTLGDGRRLIVLGEKDGQLSVIDDNQNLTFIAKDALEKGLVVNTTDAVDDEAKRIVSDQELSMDDFLDFEVLGDRQILDQQTVQQDHDGQVKALQESVNQGDTFEYGPNKIEASINTIGRDGVQVQFAEPVEINGETDAIHQLTWDQLGDAMGTPIQTENEAQRLTRQQQNIENATKAREAVNSVARGKKLTIDGKLIEVVKAIKNSQVDEQNGTMVTIVGRNSAGVPGTYLVSWDELQSQIAPLQATQIEGTSTEQEVPTQIDATPRDFRGNPLPLNPDGTVNGNQLFENDPEAWDAWNTQQKGAASSASYLGKAIAQVQAQISEIEKANAAEMDQDKITANEQAIIGLQQQIDKYQQMIDAHAVSYAEARMQEEAEYLEGDELSDEDKLDYIDEMIADVQRQLEDLGKKNNKGLSLSERREAAQTRAKIRQELEQKLQRYQELRENVGKPKQTAAQQMSFQNEADFNAMINSLSARILVTQDEAEREELINQKAKLMAEYIASIKDDATEARVMRSADAMKALADEGADQATLWKLMSAIEDGFQYNGKVYYIADAVAEANATDARTTFVHERQHGLDKQNRSNRDALISLVEAQVKKDGMTAEELKEATKRGLLNILHKLHNTKFYDSYSNQVIAEEILAYSMERAYNTTPQDLPGVLRKEGIDNEEYINLIQKIDYEQRNSSGLSKARAAGTDGVYTESIDLGTDRGNEQDQEPGSGALGEQGPGSAEPGEQQTEQVNAHVPTQQEKVSREIATNLVGGIEDEEGVEPINFSISAILEGTGLDPIIDDGHGNVIAKTKDGRIFDSRHPVTGKILSELPNTALSYMIADARRLGTVTDEQIAQIWDKYADMVNLTLYKGSIESAKINGKKTGFDNISDQWLWVGETVYKTIAANGDKQYSFSMDITRVCKKNEAVIRTIAEMQRRLGYGVTPAQVLDIYQQTEKAGYQVPCPVCYVFSRYINNGKYATIMINGQKRYGQYLKNPKFMAEEEKAEAIAFWTAELEKQKEWNDVHKKEINKAKEDTKYILTQVDKLGMEILRGNLTEEQQAAALLRMRDLDAKYAAAMNVVAQASLDGWIKNFAINTNGDAITLHEDTYMQDDWSTGFPEEIALDLRETATAITKYPAIQRYRNSRGAGAGKEITFEANNDLGETMLMLGSMSAPNHYKMAVEEEDPKAKVKLLKQATERFEKAHAYAQRQSLRGGQRMWSWSDNIEALAPDVFVNLLQLQLAGGALQSYSKQLEGIKLVAQLGGYVNGSLMGKGIGYREVSADEVETIAGKKYLKGGDFTAMYPGKRPTFLKAPVYEEKGKFYTLEFDDVVGVSAFGYDEDGQHYRGLFELNQELDKAGNILVGMNDLHIKAAMADDRVFFIIPWHASGNSVHILRQMLDYLHVDLNNFNPKDYTEVQEEKRPEKVSEGLQKFWNDHALPEDKYPCGIPGLKAGDNGVISEDQHKYKAVRDAIFVGVKDEAGKTVPVENVPEYMDIINNDIFLKQVYDYVRTKVDEQSMTSTDCGFIYPYEYWDKKSTYYTADENGARYLEYCRRLGYKPKFVGTLGAKKNDYGNFADEPGYWKLLIDRRMYDTKDQFQDLTPVHAESFSTDLVDPEQTAKEFKVTKVADKEGVNPIADAVIAQEQARPGGMHNVDYDVTGDDALAVYNQALADFNAGSRSIKKRVRDMLAGVESGFKHYDEQEEIAKAIALIDGKMQVVNTATEEEAEGDMINYRVVEDPALLEQLNNSETITVYRAMTLDEAKNLTTPMSSKGIRGKKKKAQVATEAFKKWMVSDENVDLVEYNEGEDYGHVTIQDDAGGSTRVAYNPYFHTSLQMLNDQFAKAWRRPNMVVVECEVPVWEAEADPTNPETYRAQYAKNSVGKTTWTDGPVSRTLKVSPRQVVLTRYVKPMEIVDMKEYAQSVKELLEKNGVLEAGVPFSNVTPDQRDALAAAGVPITEPKGNGRNEASLAAYEDWKSRQRDQVNFRAVTTSNPELKELNDRVNKDIDRLGSLSREQLLGIARGTIKPRDLGFEGNYANLGIGEEEIRIYWDNLLWATDPELDVYNKHNDHPIPLSMLTDIAIAVNEPIVVVDNGERGELRITELDGPEFDLEIPGNKVMLPTRLVFAVDSKRSSVKSDPYYVIKTVIPETARDMARDMRKEIKSVDDNKKKELISTFRDNRLNRGNELYISAAKIVDNFNSAKKDIKNTTLQAENIQTPGQQIRSFFDSRIGPGTVAKYKDVSIITGDAAWLVEYTGEESLEDASVLLNTDPLVMDEAVQKFLPVAKGEINKILKAHDTVRKMADDINFRVTPEQDAAYMDAVNNGDMETAQRMVRDAFKAAYPNTKVVDENGMPKVMYHGSPRSFTEFDTYGGDGFADLGMGSYFTDSEEVARSYMKPNGDNQWQIDSYIENSPELLDLLSEEGYREAEQKAIAEVFKNPKLYPVYLNITNPYITTKDDFDEDDGRFAYEDANYALRREYDGIIDRTASERFGDFMNGAYQVVAFSPNQIKSADPVTYDDNGNVIPLSQRFTESDDIRFREAWHGSAASFDRFDNAFMGTGEGAQAHGWGTYVAFEEGVGRRYAKVLGGYGLVYNGLMPISNSYEQAAIDEILSRANGNPSQANIEFILDDTRDKWQLFEKLNTGALKEHATDVLAFLSNIDASDFETRQDRNLYSLEVPDDNGSNYLDEQKVYEGEEATGIKDRVTDSLVRNGVDVENPAGVLLKSWNEEMSNTDKFAGAYLYSLLTMEMKDENRDVNETAEAASKILSDAGFVGIKYDGRVDGDCAVIFDDNDIQIKDHINFKVDEKADKAFKEAYEAGDETTARALLRAAFKAAYPNTKVVDENGEPLVVYHGSPSTFNAFKKSMLGGNTNVDSARTGFFFTPDENLADWFKDTATINGEAYDEFRENVLKFVRENATQDGIEAFLIEYDDNDYDEGEENAWKERGREIAMDILAERMDGWYGSMDELQKDLAMLGASPAKKYSVFLNVENPAIDEEFRDYVHGEVDTRMTDVLLQAKNNGNDGVIFADIQEIGGRAPQYVVFEPNQIKSADPFTFDDEGKLIPLSQRFNPETNDIRFRTIEEMDQDKLDANVNFREAEAMPYWQRNAQVSADNYYEENVFRMNRWKNKKDYRNHLAGAIVGWEKFIRQTEKRINAADKKIAKAASDKELEKLTRSQTIDRIDLDMYDRLVAYAKSAFDEAGFEMGHNLGIKSSKSVSPLEIDELFARLNTNEYSRDLYEKVSRVCKKLGVEYAFKTIEPGGQHQGGFVTYNTDFYNSEYASDQRKADTILHEMIHAVTSYAIQAVDNRYERWWRDEFGKLPNEIIDAVATLKGVYSKIVMDDSFKGTYGLTNVHEMVAELSNDDFRELLENKSLWARVKEAIADILNAFRSLFLEKQQDDATTETNAKAEVEKALDVFLETPGVQVFRDIHDVAGTMSKHKSDINDEDESVNFRFVGLGGLLRGAESAEEKKAIKDNYNAAKIAYRAENLTEDDRRKIKMATGWEKGADGKFRYEEQDFAIKFDLLIEKNADGKFDPIWLSDLIEDDGILEEYPDLKDVKVVFTDEEGVGGAYNTLTRTIEINKNKLDDIDGKTYDPNTWTLQRTLVHEIQHAIQDYENWARGGMPEMRDPRSVKYVDQFLQQKDKAEQQQLAAEDNRDKARDRLDRLNDDWAAWYDANPQYGDYTVEQLMDIPEYADFEERYRQLEEEVSYWMDQINDYDDIIDRINDRINSAENARLGFSGYERLAGEVEARNAAIRTTMSDEQRRLTLAEDTETDYNGNQIPRNQQIVYFAESSLNLEDTHDQIAQDGLASVLENYSGTMLDIYDSIPDGEVKDGIIDNAFANDGRFADATAQILASLAGKSDLTEDESAAIEAARAGLERALNKPVPTSDARWMFYQDAHRNDTSILDEARNIVVADELGFSDEKMDEKYAIDEEVRFRQVVNAQNQSAVDIYSTALGFKAAIDEAFKDQFTSVEKMVEAIVAKTGKKPKDFENIMYAMNQLSSRNFADKATYIRDFLAPMWDVIKCITQVPDRLSMEDIIKYVQLKHGLERNEKFARRDAREYYKDWKKKMKNAIDNLDEQKLQDQLSDMQVKLADLQNDLNAMIAANEAVSKIKKKEKEIKDLQRRMDETQDMIHYINVGEQELNDDYDRFMIDLEQPVCQDPIYLENRKQDYSGLMSWFFTEGPVTKRKRGESKETYRRRMIAARRLVYDNLADAEQAAQDYVDQFEKDATIYASEVDTFNAKKGVVKLPAGQDTRLTDMLWEKINAATKETLRHQYASGMINKGSYEALKKMFDYYVPLRGFKDDSAEDVYAYYNSNANNDFSAPVLTAKGRRSVADNPFGVIGQMAESGIQQDNKNLAKQALYNFVANRPGNGLAEISECWYEDSGSWQHGKKVWIKHYPDITPGMSQEDIQDAWDQLESDMQAKAQMGIKVFKGKNDLELKDSVVHIGSKSVPEHFVSLKVGGKDYDIIVNASPRAAQAINGLLNVEADPGPAKRFLMYVTRLYAAFSTSWNVEFGGANFFRDMQFGAVTTFAEQNKEFQAKYHKNLLKILKNGRIFRLSSAYNESNLEKTERLANGKEFMIEKNHPELVKAWKEYVESGGPTGFTVLTNNKEYDRKMDEYLSNQFNKEAIKAIKGLLGAVSDVMEAIEQVARFSAYLTAKEMGMSTVASVNAAKEVTLNFNRKGSGKVLTPEDVKSFDFGDGKWGAFKKGLAYFLTAHNIFRPSMMFLNATVQSLARFIKLMRTVPEKMALVAAVEIVAGFGNAMVHAFMGMGDGDDDYLDLPTYERRTHYMIGLGNKKRKDKGAESSIYVKIPIAQELVPFYTIGDIIATQLILDKYPNRNPVSEVAEAFGELLPFNPTHIVSKDIANEYMKGFTPIKPFFDLMKNENFYGGQIYPDSKWATEAEKENAPKWEQAFPRTSPAAVGVSKVLSNATGGDEVVGGKINVSPEKMQYMVEESTKGLGKFLSKLFIDAPAMLVGDQEFTVKRTPFISRLMTDTGERNTNAYVMEEYNWFTREIFPEMERREKEYEKARKDGADVEKSLEKLRNSPEWKIYDEVRNELKSSGQNAIVPKTIADRQKDLKSGKMYGKVMSDYEIQALKNEISLLQEQWVEKMVIRYNELNK